MPENSRNKQALALIAALQTILDKLPAEPEEDDAVHDQPQTELPGVRNPTHELYVERLNQGSLASLFTSIRIIHNIHNVNKHPAATPTR